MEGECSGDRARYKSDICYCGQRRVDTAEGDASTLVAEVEWCCKGTRVVRRRGWNDGGRGLQREMGRKTRLEVR